MAKPFVKWLGSKRQLVPELLWHVPKHFNRYYEPFLGGGALFFALQERGLAPRPFLSDVNANLINTYVWVRDRLLPIIEGLDQINVPAMTEEWYKCVRYRYNETIDERTLENAVLFIAINKTGFNGLYRVNSKGKCNVPWGKRATANLYDHVALEASSVALYDTVIRAMGYRQFMENYPPDGGDLVYFDPPYIPVSATADFTNYAAGGFGMGAQEELCRYAWNLKQRGVHVILSNSDTPATRELYKDFDIHEVKARRAINSNGAKRGPVGELIIT